MIKFCGVKNCTFGINGILSLAGIKATTALGDKQHGLHIL